MSESNSEYGLDGSPEEALTIFSGVASISLCAAGVVTSTIYGGPLPWLLWVLAFALLGGTYIKVKPKSRDHLQGVKEPYLQGTIDEDELEDRLEYKLEQQGDVYYHEEKE